MKKRGTLLPALRDNEVGQIVTPRREEGKRGTLANESLNPRSVRALCRLGLGSSVRGDDCLPKAQGLLFPAPAAASATQNPNVDRHMPVTPIFLRWSAGHHPLVWLPNPSFLYLQTVHQHILPHAQSDASASALSSASVFFFPVFPPHRSVTQTAAASSTSLQGKQTSQTSVTLFDDDDRLRSSRESIGSGEGEGKKQHSRPQVPPIEGIPLSRVGTEPDSRHQVVPGGITRPSSAPGPGIGNASALETHGAGGVPAVDGANSGEGLSRSAPDSSKRSAATAGSKGRPLSVTVRNLMGTNDGLVNLRASLQDGGGGGNSDGEGGAATAAAAAAAAARATMRDSVSAGGRGGGRGHGAGVAMMMPEAVARAAGQGAAGAAAARLSIALRPSSAPSFATARPVTKKASVFGGLVQTLVESNVSRSGGSRVLTPPWRRKPTCRQRLRRAKGLGRCPEISHRAGS